jgi:TRAP-type C4-dicarboxylate transport system permease small subunit
MAAEVSLLPQRLTDTVRVLCTVLAVLGTLTLAGVMLSTNFSIIGRALSGIGLRPILGDFEIVEAGTAFAIFCFLPWCQFARGHASVDVFTLKFPPQLLRIIDLVIDIAFAVVISFIIWRMWLGMGDKFANGQKTFILQMPVWWVYAGGMVGAVSWLVVSYYCLAESLISVVTGRDKRAAESVHA